MRVSHESVEEDEDDLEDVPRIEAVRRPGRGAVNSHPHWVMLGYASETPLDSRAGKVRNRAFRNIQIATLTAYLAQSARGDTNHKRLRGACALIRRFGGTTHLHALEQYGGCIQVEDLYQRAVQHHRDEEYPVGPFAGALADFLSAALGLGHEPVIRGGSGGNRGQRRARGARQGEGALHPEHRSYDLLLYGVADAELYGHPIEFGVNEPSPENARKLTDEGIDPLEYAEPDVSWVQLNDLYGSQSTKAKPTLKALPPLQTVYGSARNQMRAQQLAAQRFTTRRERITVPELATILGALDEAQRELGPLGPEPTTASRTAHEALLLAAIVFATGTPPDAARDLRAWPGNPGGLPSTWTLAYEPPAGPQHGPAWRRPCLLPSRGSQRDARNVVLARDMASISLSDSWGVGPRLDSLASQTGGWFRHSLGELQTAFAKLITPRLVAAGIPKRWLSMKALADLLPTWLLGIEEGDQLRVSLAFARQDALASVHLFYAAYDPYVLDEWYTAEVKRLRKRLANCGYTTRAGGLFSSPTRAFVGRVIAGDERILSPTDLKATTKAVLEATRPPQGMGQDELLRRHNMITCYVAMFLGICTGFRAVRTPIPDLSLIDDETGFLALQEKDDVHRSSGRIVWIPPRLREQVEIYLRYLRELWHDLPSTPKTILVPANKQRDRSRLNVEAYPLELGRTLFLLERRSGHVEAREFRGSDLKNLVESVAPGGWPFPNSARHFLRSILAHRGCPATVINALMGHAHIGEGPWSPHSAFDPYRYRETLATLLNKLLDELDFQVIRP